MKQIRFSALAAMLVVVGCSEKTEPDQPKKEVTSDARPAITDVKSSTRHYTPEEEFLKFDVAGFYAGMTREDAEKRLIAEGWTDGTWTRYIEQFEKDVAKLPQYAIDTTSGVWHRGEESIALYQYQPVNGPRSIWGVTYKRRFGQVQDVGTWVQRLKDKYGKPYQEKSKEPRVDLLYRFDETPDVKARAEKAHYRLAPTLDAYVIREYMEIRYSNPIVLEPMMVERHGAIDAAAKTNAGDTKQGF